MAITPTVVEFDRDNLPVVISHFDRLTSAGAGWINVGPALDADEWDAIPHKTGIAKWVSGRGPAVPMATWTPSSVDRRPRAAQIGIAHGTGPHALRRLGEAGLDLPTGWLKRQDHARNGIVIDLPDGTRPEAFVPWLLRVMDELAQVVETGDRWIAEVHEP